MIETKLTGYDIISPFVIKSGINIYPEVSGSQSLGTASNPFASVYTHQILVSGSSAGGDVVGPSSSLTNSIPTFSNTTGKLLKDDNGVTITPSGTLNATVLSATTISGSTLNLTGQLTSTSGASFTAPITNTSTYSGTSFIGDTTMLNFVIDGGGAVIATGSQGHVEIPWNATSLSWDLTGNISGTLSVDVRRDTYANFAGTPFATGLSIVDAQKPTITTAFKGSGVTTNWSGLSAGNFLNFVVDGTPANITRATLSLKLRKTS